MNKPDPSPRCDHCRGPIPPGELVDDPDSGKKFCCHGCMGVWRIITGAGLDDFYRKRTWQEEGPVQGAFDARPNHAALAEQLRHRAEGDELLLQIEGIRCAACIWLIEKMLEREDGVLEARCSHATHQLRLLFDPARTGPERLFTLISRLGYRPAPPSRSRQRAALQREQRTLLLRFGTALFFTFQVKGYSLALYAGYFQGMETDYRLLIQGFAAVLTAPVVFYSGWPFLVGGFRGLRNRAPDMDLLVALGVLATYGYSLYAMRLGGEVYFDTAAVIITLILLGRLLEHGARRKASAGLERLLRLSPETANRLEGDTLVLINADQLEPGDLILVRPGERFPVDGHLAGGRTEVDEAIISGEPMPVIKKEDDPVAGGAINVGSAVRVRVLHRTQDSFIARIAALVAEAQLRKAPVQRMADRVVAAFVPLVLLLALGTALFWFGRGMGLEAALLPAVAVLVVACPCALGLATPTAILVASGAAAQQDLLFRGGDVLEKLAGITLVAFDKTGTLSLGRPSLRAIIPTCRIDMDEDRLLGLAARLAQGSSHPLARAIVAEAQLRGMAIEKSLAETIPGRGIRETTDTGDYRLGKADFLADTGVSLPPDPEHEGQSVSHLASDKQHLASFFFDDPLRPEAEDATTSLHRLGIQTALLSGDQQANADRVAGTLSLDQAFGNLEPAQKKEWINRAEQRGERVLMVGDGINDAPALAAASVGCSLSGGTDVAMESADLLLTRADLRLLPKAITLSRQTLRIIRQNLFWAFFYNLLALPLAASGTLAPIHAAAAMAASSLCVIGNSLRLARRTPC